MKRPDFETIPKGPGIYLFKRKPAPRHAESSSASQGKILKQVRNSGLGQVLYVGKATNLRKRLRSYFTVRLKNPKIHALLAQAEKVEWIETDSEVEALLLESNLIKEHRPPFNVVLRDDKNYLYLKITLGEDYPRLLFARRIDDSKSKFFGPYTSSKDLRRTLSLLRKIFPLCSADYVIREKDILSGKQSRRPCLNYRLGRCPGVCMGKVTSREYRKTIQRVIRFLEGDWQEALKRLENEMKKAAEEKKFEKAAFLRDRKRSLEKLMEEQKVILPDARISRDIFGLARALTQAVVAILIIRQGRLLDQKLLAFEDPSASLGAGRFKSSEGEILERAIYDYYQKTSDLPREIVLPAPISKTLQRWLADKKVKITIPQRGGLKKMVGLAVRNATNQLFALSRSLTRENIEEELLALKKILGVRKLSRIEAYDISHLSGTDAVGSMVVFLDGVPAPVHYRRFKIKLAKPSDDFGALLEVLKRRFRTRYQAQGTKYDLSFVSHPDLILIDGGRGQLSAALRALGNRCFKLLALAKKQEEIFVPDRREPIKLPEGHPARRLLQRIRDEAHRFAVSYHVKLRRKAALGSALDSIRGIGPVRRRMLVKRFGSLRAAAEAPLEKLAVLLKNETLARKVKKSLK